MQFSYCRQTGVGLPCSKIYNCWSRRFDVERYLKAHFSEKQIHEALKPPKPKMNALLELIAQAKHEK